MGGHPGRWRRRSLPALTAVRVTAEMGGLDDAARWLPEGEQARVARLRQAGDRRRAVAGALLLRWSLVEHAGCHPARLVISRDDLERPQVEGDVDANLSHSGDWVVVGVAARARVGVDVEQVRANALSPGEWLTDQEAAFLASLPPARRAGALFELWTAKEAYVKAIGSGLRSLAAVALDVHALAHGELRAAPGSGLQSWRFQAYPLDPAYRLAWCSESPPTPSSVEVVRSVDLRRWAAGAARGLDREDTA